ncbi:TadE/TadG family type IV pilus assembly protein [Limnobacter parvus]|uniref:Pilus assembly protein n=1 Tax=Limnobacter parvus TaxID=2939690 RepID=A0ABT1XH96_9BURK|nr:TadE family protein [Limnobacter parvus]MCR2745637.1 pilus assembly protein [Limnobacter parvus]
MNLNIRASSATGFRADRQRGAQLVELALMLPVVLTVIFAIVGYSLLFMIQHTLSSAVSQGARSVAVAGSTADPEAAARQLLLNALPSAMYPAGFSFSTDQLAGAADCGNALGGGTNPTLNCLEFRGFFTTSENAFLSNIPFADTFFPDQLSASAVVLYQSTDAL